MEGRRGGEEERWRGGGMNGVGEKGRGTVKITMKMPHRELIGC